MITPDQRQTADLLRRENLPLELVLQSDCMAPSLPKGTKVQVVATTVSEITPGDILILGHGSRYYCHRLLTRIHLKNGQTILLCKGDRMRRVDEPWKEEALIGRVTGRDHQGSPPSCSWLSRTAARLYGWVAWQAVRAGIRPHRRPPLLDERAGRPLFFRLNNKRWHVESEDPGLLDEFRHLLPAGNDEHEGAAFECLLTLHSGMPEDGHTRFALKADGLFARFDEESGRGELWLKETRGLKPGVEGFFRLVAAKRALRGEGVTLHATSVKTARGLFLFIGPSGTGKTTAAETYPEYQRIDEDLVFLMREDRGWMRKPWFPFMPKPERENGMVRALFFPERSEFFSLEKRSAVAALPGLLQTPPGGLRADNGEELLASICRLSQEVPAFRLRWMKGMDLPSLLESALNEPTAGSPYPNR